jgi:hypothetical protein
MTQLGQRRSESLLVRIRLSSVRVAFRRETCRETRETLSANAIGCWPVSGGIRPLARVGRHWQRAPPRPLSSFNGH